MAEIHVNIPMNFDDLISLAAVLQSNEMVARVIIYDFHIQKFGFALPLRQG